MAREKEKIFNNFFAIIDILLTILSFIAAYFIRKFYLGSGIVYTDQYIIIVFSIIPIWGFLLKFSNLTRLIRTQSYSSVLLDYLKLIITGSAIIFATIFIFKFSDISRIVIFLFGLIDFIVLYASKITMFMVFKAYRKKGLNIRYIVIYADDKSANFIRNICSNSEWGYSIKAIITSAENIKELYQDTIKIYPLDFDINNFLENETVDEIIYTIKNVNLDELKKLIYSCEEIGVAFKLKSDFFGLVKTQAEIEYMGATPFLKFSHTPTDYFALKAKSLFDIVFSFLVLVLLSPLFLIISIIIKLTSRGPVFFKQKRVGLRGRPFYLYKFRTMVANAEKLKDGLMDKNEMDGPVFKIKNDPRITKIGQFLRKTSLDELPQFINVIKGEMSVVGPRPPLQKEVQMYLRWQLRRLSMKPGITCIWQISGRNNINFEDWMRLDLRYIDNWKLSLDLTIVLRTIKVMFTQNGAS